MNAARLPGESPAYRKLREELVQAEIALKDQIERVAALRRSLPRDTPVPLDYALREGPRDLDAGDAPVRGVRLSELFDEPAKPLVLVHFMFGGAQREPCPMCTMWADGYAGVVQHLSRRVNFGVVFAGDLATMQRYARERGWRQLRLLSAEGTGYGRDLGLAGEDGSQMPGVSVFTRAEDGSARHFYTTSAMLAPGHWRGMDLLSPVWNFFDLSPEGRGDFMPKRSYAG